VPASGEDFETKPSHLNEMLRDALLQPSLCPSLEEITAGATRIPACPGIYGWWFRTLPPKITDEGVAKGPFGSLLYIGIAPNGPCSSRTLRDRIRNHMIGPIGSSTLRRSLAVLLAEPLELQLRRSDTNRLLLPRKEESRLTEWMQKMARVCWVVCDEPWQVEKSLLAHGPRLPLNIQGSDHPFARQLREMRATG
jgi:hypothetical protein